MGRTQVSGPIPTDSSPPPSDGRASSATARARRGIECRRGGVGTDGAAAAPHTTMTRLIAALLLLICIAPSPRAAQTSATLVGIVQDAQGGRLPGVTVRIRDLATGVARELVTDAEGRFRATALSAGEYELRASLEPFRPLVQTGVRLTVGESAAVTLTMQVGTAEEVTVRGTSAVNTQTGDLSFLTDQRTIEQIPVNGRNYTDLMQLQPGRQRVSEPRQRLGGRARAGDERQRPEPANQHLPAGRHAAERLHQQPGQQRRRHRAGDGDDPRVPARIEQLQRRIRPRRGRADQRHHQVGHQPASPAAPSRSIATARSMPATTSTIDEKPSFRRYQVGGTLGGPLRPDRMFVFVGYEGLFENLGRTIVTTVPDDNARRGILPTGQVAINPSVLPYLLEFPVANGPSLGDGLAQHRFGFDQRLDSELLAGPLRRGAVRRRAVVRPLHAGRCRAGPADRLPAVPARVRLAEPVPDRGIPARAVAVDLRHGAVRLQRHAHRPDRRVEHHAGRVAVRARAADDGRHRHRRRAPLRPAALGRPGARTGRLQRPGRCDARARPPSAEGRRRSSSAIARPSSTRPSAAASIASRACRRSSPAPRRRSSA